MTDTNHSEGKAAESTTERTVGRNEPCPCGSRKKYKRCCGVSAAPKLSQPKQDMGGSMFNPSMLDGMDPQMMMQLTQAFQRLPKGQLQRMQSLMQKAMSGKDISVEAQEFEKSLPSDFQEMMRSWGAAAMTQGGMGAEGADLSLSGISDSPFAQLEAPGQDSSGQNSSGIDASVNMSEEEARALVAKAVAEGKISKEAVEGLLNTIPASDSSESSSENAENPSDEQGDSSSSKFGRFWKNIKGK